VNYPYIQGWAELNRRPKPVVYHVHSISVSNTICLLGLMILVTVMVVAVWRELYFMFH
jgi:hypothetical protein